MLQTSFFAWLLTATFLLLSGLTGCGRESPVIYSWSLQSQAVKTSIDYQELESFCQSVLLMSGGRLEITPHPGGELTDGPDIFRAVSEGRIQMGNGWPNWWSGQHDAWSVLDSGPFGFMNLDASMMFFYVGAGTDIANELSLPQGVMWRPAWWAGMELGLLSREPIRGLDDLRGKKVRIGPGLPSEVLASASGAYTIPLVPEEIKLALESKDLDAVEWTTPSGALSLGIDSLVSYALTPAVWQPSVLSDFLINQQAYEQLPKDLREILEVGMRSFALTTTFKSKVADFDALTKLQQQGIAFARWSEEDLKRWRIHYNKVLLSYRERSEISDRLIREKQRFKEDFNQYYQWFGPY
ncbi:TRAP transporter substrate-binding protein DctP [Teredinibacter franksiae]|uniref:TRAP transporter substrate-binding protein DctP n=1 Tax=Teredinibacter franksiae TaxID=2761453 RepID=UPI0016294846|nr:TRAP transporter substrate-binding protein DctP [Teredinibacter franksiae]